MGSTDYVYSTLRRTARLRHPQPSQITLTLMRDAALEAMRDAGG
jgi:hypothetical protein